MVDDDCFLEAEIDVDYLWIPIKEESLAVVYCSVAVDFFRWFCIDDVTKTKSRSLVWKAGVLLLRVFFKTRS